MGSYAIVISLLVIFCIIIFEIYRPKEIIIDFITAINIIYCLIYGIVPIYLYFFYEHTTWITIKKNSLNEETFFYGILLSVVCYLCLIFGYYFASKLMMVKKIDNFSTGIFSNISDLDLVKPGIILTIIGIASQLIYISVIGGFNNYLTLGTLLRSEGDIIQSPFMFLKNIVPLIYMGSFIFYALFIGSKEKLNKMIFGLIFLVTFMFSLLHLFHVSGRIPILYYLLTFPLGHAILKNKLKKRQILFGLIMFLFLVIFGDLIMNSNRTVTFKETLGVTISNLGLTLGSVIEEFSFPYTNIANNLLIFPVDFDFRFAITDLIIGLKNVLPSRLLPFDIFDNETLTSFNTRQFGTRGAIPVDLVSFGYISFGSAGVMLIGFCFGVLTKVIEALFSYRRTIIATLFYSYWLFFVASRVMYADPGLVYDNAFKLVVATFLLFIFSRSTNQLNENG